MIVRLSLVSENHALFFCICVYAPVLVFGIYVYDYIIWVATIVCLT